MALVVLQRTGGTTNPTREAVAQKIINLAKAGERDPKRLCDEALKAAQAMAPALISAPNPPPPRASPLAQPVLELQQSDERPSSSARPSAWIQYRLLRLNVRGEAGDGTVVTEP
jgi:hypothetical protein